MKIVNIEGGNLKSHKKQCFMSSVEGAFLEHSQGGSN